MSGLQPVVLVRDCPATTVPHGEPIELSAGGVVAVVQRLGTSITVRTELGSLLRIDEAHADALGLEPSPAAEPAERNVSLVGDAAAFSMDLVTQALDTVYDPEIPVSIVALGLVYRCEEVQVEGEGRVIEIDLSMTAPGCGMGDILRQDAKRVVEAVPGVDRAEVVLVWDPPWSVERMSDAVRLQLGLL